MTERNTEWDRVIYAATRTFGYQREREEAQAQLVNLGRRHPGAIAYLLNYDGRLDGYGCAQVAKILRDIGAPARRFVYNTIETRQGLTTAAIQAADYLRIEEAAPLLVGYLNRHGVNPALSTMMSMPETSTPILVEELRKEGDRQPIVNALKNVAAIWPPAIEQISVLLRDEAEHTRFNAAETLGLIGALAEPALRKALDDQNPLVREKAVWGLGVMGKRFGIADPGSGKENAAAAARAMQPKTPAAQARGERPGRRVERT